MLVEFVFCIWILFGEVVGVVNNDIYFMNIKDIVLEDLI